MSLISRYILRETFGAWLVVVAVLFTVLMAKQFADILGDAAAQRLPRDAVWLIFALTSMRYVTQLSPIALFLGVMYKIAAGAFQVGGVRLAYPDWARGLHLPEAAGVVFGAFLLAWIVKTVREWRTGRMSAPKTM